MSQVTPPPGHRAGKMKGWCGVICVFGPDGWSLCRRYGPDRAARFKLFAEPQARPIPVKGLRAGNYCRTCGERWNALLKPAEAGDGS